MRSPRRETVRVRTPTAGTTAPSSSRCSRMNTSHLIRISPVVCETANATSGVTGTTTLLSTTGMGRGYAALI